MNNLLNYTNVTALVAKKITKIIQSLIKKKTHFDYDSNY